MCMWMGLVNSAKKHLQLPADPARCHQLYLTNYCAMPAPLVDKLKVLLFYSGTCKDKNWQVVPSIGW